MGGTVAALVLDVMGGVLLVGTVVGAIVPVGGLKISFFLGQGTESIACFTCGLKHQNMRIVSL